jgi:DNA processing protein
LILNALPGIGPVALHRLLEAFGGDPRAILGAGERRLASVEGIRPTAVRAVSEWRAKIDLANEERNLASRGASFLIREDEAYPRLLREIHDPPIGLYKKGAYDLKETCIAVIGSRRTTLYGSSVAKRLGAELVRLGFCVVSGLARGIDTAAHEGALAAGGRTVAVLGSGLDTVYPPENCDLCERIARDGAVLSEFPFGRGPDRQTFPMRNRIVSGLSEAAVVVESDVDGGAMITARFAAEQGRTVFAVPGRIDQATSAGCHQLIRDGATLLTSVDDILSELSYLKGFRRPLFPSKPEQFSSRIEIAQDAESDPAPSAGLSEEERQIMVCLGGGEILTPDAIGERLSLPSQTLAAGLTMLELKRLVSKRADGAYEAEVKAGPHSRRRPSP